MKRKAKRGAPGASEPRAAAGPAVEEAALDDDGRVFVTTAAEMRELDRRTIALGVPGEVLMERAGGAVAEVLQRHFRDEVRRGVLLVAGKGNNGGDAFVAARRLRGRDVVVFLAGRRSEIGGDAAAALERWTAGGGAVRELADGGLAALAEAADRAGVVVDGLFGTGLRGPLDERSRAVVEVLNAASAPIVAIDVPSGLDADRGVPLGAAVQATVTVTFAYPKPGLLLEPGASLAGEVVVADIGIARSALEAVAPKQRLLTEAVVARALPPREPDTHKGTYGHVLLLAGSAGKSGAAMLAGRAALRAGAGLATVAAPAPALAGFTAATPELMTEPLEHDDGRWAFSEADPSAILGLVKGKSAIVFGPGCGTGSAVAALGRWLFELAPLPLVVDADGLNVLAGEVGRLGSAGGGRSPVVLTPHPGEMARLLRTSVAEVQSDRIGAARKLAAESRAVVVLKGSRTVVASPDGLVSVNPTGNPGMASGGMGDALAGIVGALLAQGLSAAEAAEVGVYWHGAAADRVALERGEAGLLATDVIEALPPALADLQDAVFGPVEAEEGPD